MRYRALILSQADTILPLLLERMPTVCHHQLLVLQNIDAIPSYHHSFVVQQTGVAVINGAISTLIAALCLSGSGSYVFVTFFYALLFIVILGAIQGLVVLPVLLDIFRPAPHAVTSHAVTSQDEELAN